MMDGTDFKIISILKSNSRMQMQEIGELVHLTGQAVRNRINRMEKAGVIEGYTINVNMEKLGVNIEAFITVFMKTNDHDTFKRFLLSNANIIEANRTSGEGCYLLKVNVGSNQKLGSLLDEILKFGNYKINTVIEKVK